MMDRFERQQKAAMIVLYHIGTAVLFGVWQHTLLGGLFAFGVLACMMPTRNL